MKNIHLYQVSRLPLPCARACVRGDREAARRDTSGRGGRGWGGEWGEGTPRFIHSSTDVSTTPLRVTEHRSRPPARTYHVAFYTFL